MTINWGEELWDQYDNIAQHTYKGVEFLERLGHFVRDRSSVEIEYATKLRRLVKSYQLKKKEEDELQFSTCKAFKEMLLEVGFMAGQHEVIAENLTTGVAREIQNLGREFKDERKKWLQEGARLQNTLSNQLAMLERSKKAYEKAWRESEKAQELYQKADADLNLSRAEVQKHQMNASMKSHQCEEAKNEYAAQLQKTNELQRQHYDQLMPDIFMNLRDLDMRRIQGYQTFMRKYVEIERDVEPIVSKCLDGILHAADAIQEDEDSRLVIEKFKSGFPIPTDFPFEDLSAMKSGESSTALNGGGGSGEDVSKPALAQSNSNGGGGGGGESPGGVINGIGKSKGGLTLKGTLSASRLKKRGGIFGIFGSHKNGNASPFPESKEDWNDLPPNQRRKKVQQKLDELAAKIQQETATRDGLLKMKDVYTSNPALGDPASIEGQLSESGVRLDRLRKDLAQFQALQEEFSATLPSSSSSAAGSATPNPSAGGGGGHHRRSTGSSGGGAKSPSSGPNVHGSSSSRLAAPGGVGDRNSGSAASSDRHSLSDEGESLSRSASDSSVSNPANPNEPLGGKLHHNPRHRLLGGSAQKSQPSSNGWTASHYWSHLQLNMDYKGLTTVWTDQRARTRNGEQPRGATTGGSNGHNLGRHGSGGNNRHDVRSVDDGAGMSQQHRRSPYWFSDYRSPSTTAIPKLSSGSSNSPESGLGTSRVSLPDSESGVGSGSGGAASASNDPHLAEDETDYFFDDGEPLTVLGTCRALYTFDAQSEGSIPMIEGEDLQVIELDQGDGWTRVRRNDQSEEGFVPTSYIEISLRGTC